MDTINNNHYNDTIRWSYLTKEQPHYWKTDLTQVYTTVSSNSFEEAPVYEIEFELSPDISKLCYPQHKDKLEEILTSFFRFVTQLLGQLNKTSDSQVFHGLNLQRVNDNYYLS